MNRARFALNLAAVAHPNQPGHRRRQLLTAVLAVVAVTLTAFAAVDQRWFVADSSEGAFAIGLVKGEMCLTSGSCRAAPLSSFESGGQAPRLGLFVFFAAIFAGLLLFAATARMLLGRSRFAALPRLALFAAIFSAALGGAWLIISPWSASMAPGIASIAFFVGTALAAATAAVPLGALRSAE